MSKMPEVKRMHSARMPDELTEVFSPARFRVYRTDKPDYFDIGWGGQRVGMIRWIEQTNGYFLGSMTVEGQAFQAQSHDIESLMHSLLDMLEASLVYVSQKFLNA